MDLVRRSQGPWVAASFALVYATVLLLRGHPYDVDRVTQFLPYAAAAGEAFSRWELPLWTSDIWAGFPLMAEGQVGALSPLQLAWWLASDAYQLLDIQFVLALVLAALSGSCAARLLGIDHPGAALAGVVWSLGGGLLAYQDNPSVVATCLAMPMVLASAYRGRLVWTVLGLVFSVSCGHPYFYGLSFVLALIGWLAGLRGRIGPDDSAAREALRGVGALALAVCAGAVQWLPTLELVRQSDRVVLGMSAEARNLAQLWPTDLVHLLWPTFSEGLRYSSGSGVLAYVGLIGLVLALLCSRPALRGEPEVRLLAALGGGTLLLALLVTLAGDALAGVPLLGLLRGPSKLLIVVGLALALLAGKGLGSLGSAPLRWGLVLLVALDLGSYGQRKADPVDREALRAAPRVAELIGAGRIRVVGTQAMWGSELRGEDPRARLREGQPLDANCGLLYGIQHVDGYSPLRTARATLYAGSLAPLRLRRAAVTHVVVGPQLPAPAGLEPIARAERWVLYRVPDPLPRAFASTRTLRARGVLGALAAVDREAPEVVVLEGPDQGEVADAGASGGLQPVTIRSWEAGRIELGCDMPRAGVVVASDSHYPGWEVEVDGEARPLLLANFAFKGVQVPAGEHSVVFSYRPQSFRIGALLSLLGLLTLVVLAWRARPWEDLADAGS